MMKASVLLLSLLVPALAGPWAGAQETADDTALSSPMSASGEARSAGSEAPETTDQGGLRTHIVPDDGAGAQSPAPEQDTVARRHPPAVLSKLRVNGI